MTNLGLGPTANVECRDLTPLNYSIEFRGETVVVDQNYLSGFRSQGSSLDFDSNFEAVQRIWPKEQVSPTRFLNHMAIENDSIDIPFARL